MPFSQPDVSEHRESRAIRTNVIGVAGSLGPGRRPTPASTGWQRALSALLLSSPPDVSNLPLPVAVFLEGRD